MPDENMKGYGETKGPWFDKQVRDLFRAGWKGNEDLYIVRHLDTGELFVRPESCLEDLKPEDIN